jgi:branched-chain amino acid transport system substrate-binding protein
MSRGSSEHSSRNPSYIATPPDEPHSSASRSEGFVELAARHEPRPRTVAFVSADAELTRNAVIEPAQIARWYGFTVANRITYSLSTREFAPIVETVASDDPDVLLLLCSSPADSLGLVEAAQMNDVVRPRPGTTTGRRVETPRPQRAGTSKGPHHAPHR